MYGNYVNVNLKIDDYTNRVLNVIKAKYGLKDKSKALMFFAKKYGFEFVDSEASDEYIRNMKENTDNHIKNKGFRNRNIDELRREIESD